MAPAVVERILHAAPRDSSAGNLRSSLICFVREPHRRARLAAAAGDVPFLAGAPVDLVFLADTGRARATYGPRARARYALEDATLAAAFAVLEAVDEGLATAWVGAFEDETVRPVCETPGLDPVAIVPVGHGRGRPPPTSRGPLDEVLRER